MTVQLVSWDVGGGLHCAHVVVWLMWGGALCCNHAAEEVMRLVVLSLGMR